ncbi:MAG TPA: hypothetical protein VGL05_19750 [Kribbella sp.]
MKGWPDIPLTYGLARRLQAGRARGNARDVLITVLAEHGIAQIEQHLKEVSER